MANRQTTFLLKRSNVPGKIPSSSGLTLGELALNTADAILYTSGTTVNNILPIGWDRIHRTGDTVTGDFNYFGDITIGGNLTVSGGSGINWFSGNTSTDILRVTQTGSGNAFVVEDSDNPDSSPFVITSGGSVGINTSNPSSKLEIKATDNLSTTKSLSVKDNLDTKNLFSIGNNGIIEINHPSFSGTNSIFISANNQVTFSTDLLSTYMRVGPTNVVDFSNQAIKTNGAAVLGTIRTGVPYILNLNEIQSRNELKKGHALKKRKKSKLNPKNSMYLLEIFKKRRFTSEKFAIEATTKRLKKYTYQPTKDGKYIIELGIYSPQADTLIQFIKK
jgi:hypothetical protein